MVTVIELNNYRKSTNTKKYSIIEKSTYFECIIDKERQGKYKHIPNIGVGIGGVYAVVVKPQGKPHALSSVHFLKDSFKLPEVVEWLDTYSLSILKDDQGSYTINQCKAIRDVVRVEEELLVLYKRGKDSLTIDYANLTKGGEITTLKPLDVVLIINGEQIDYVPRINIDKNRDVLIVNGNCIVADYIDEYDGNVGFYLKSNPALPTAFIFTEETIIYMEIVEKERGKIYIIEYDYEIHLL